VTLRAGLARRESCDGRVITRTCLEVDAVVNDEARMTSQVKPRETLSPYLGKGGRSVRYRAVVLNVSDGFRRKLTAMEP
jgi:hypothetical protein